MNLRWQSRKKRWHCNYYALHFHGRYFGGIWTAGHLIIMLSTDNSMGLMMLVFSYFLRFQVVITTPNKSLCGDTVKPQHPPGISQPQRNFCDIKIRKVICYEWGGDFSLEWTFEEVFLQNSLSSFWATQGNPQTAQEEQDQKELNRVQGLRH